MLFPFLSEVTEIFCKLKSKFLNSRVIAGGFVMGCAKKSWFQVYYKKVVEKSACSITKSLKSQTKVWKLARPDQTRQVVIPCLTFADYLTNAFISLSLK